MDLSIIIVSWNIKDKLRECLRSIAETTPPPQSSPIEGEEAIGNSPPLVGGVRGGGEERVTYEVFVVDNASKDGSAQMARQEFPWVHLIANDYNAGFAKANNQALRQIVDSRSQVAPLTPPSPLWGEGEGSEFVLLLNPDMRLFPGALEGMVKFMREPKNARVGIAGCHLIDNNGKTVSHVRKFPTITDQAAIILKLPHIFPNILDNYLMKDFDYSKEARVDSIRGSFFMIRRELLDKIGLLDEQFFIWFEEVDFCKRAIAAGYQVAYTPTVKCVDYVGQSFKQIAQYKKQTMFTESMLKYFKKWKPWWQWVLLAILRPIGLGMAWTMDLYNPLPKGEREG